MTKQYDVVALGESLIDFTPAGINEMGMQLFSCNPGGAPSNVLAMFTKLEGKTAFIGKVGNDAFGRFLTQNMAEADIDISGVQKDAVVPTTLAFVQLDEYGDRSFSFYRNPGADLMLTNNEVPLALLKNCRTFHFGSVSLTDEPCRSATLEAAKTAKTAGAIISYDPNYRPFLWKDSVHAREELTAAVPLADLVKVSDEEMTFLTGQTDFLKGASALAELGPVLIVVTLGDKGAYFYTKNASALVPTYLVDTVDTTGAGDAFWGALLWQIKGKCLDEIAGMSEDAWRKVVQFANAAGSLTTTSKGAIPAMPDKFAIDACLKQNKI